MANSHTKSVTEMDIEEYRAYKAWKREEFLKQFPPKERPKHRSRPARAIVRQDDKRRKDLELETFQSCPKPRASAQHAGPTWPSTRSTS